MRPRPRLAPFFHLSGLIVEGPTTVRVELRPFHDQQYNRDLVRLCEQVTPLLRSYQMGVVCASRFAICFVRF